MRSVAIPCSGSQSQDGGYREGGIPCLDKVSIGLNVAASEFKVAGKNEYDIDFKTPAEIRDASMLLAGDELIAFYKDMLAKYPIVTIHQVYHSGSL